MTDQKPGKSSNNIAEIEKKDSAMEKEGSASFQKFDGDPKKIDKTVLNTISEELARKHQMVFFAKEGKLLKVAMVDPQDVEALNVLQFIAEKEKMEIEIYTIEKKVIKEILNQYKTAESFIEEAVQSFDDDVTSGDEFGILSDKEDETDEKIGEVIKDTPIAKLVQVVINHAIEGKASDIHIEPIENSFRVRYRVDGVLHASLVLPKDVGRAVISRIKILANLKIDEKRKPQDGRFKIEIGGNKVDFRISTLPVIEGEKVVMRVLDKESGLLDLKSLGLLGRNHDVLSRKIQEPYGIVLITGPTGSGKSTTLYAFLSILNKEERNIITLEDPVEYFIEGINQSQIKPEIGYTFASGLRSILRQDPNVIMVGEIRDNETAELAIHAALTGHLVFSTLHTNSAIGSIPRLIDMEVEPFLLSYSLRALVAQRLVRRVCENCKKEMDVPQKLMREIEEELKNVPDKELENYGLDRKQPPKFYIGQGCEECNKLGLRGRLAIYEVLEVTDEIQKLISEGRATESEIQIQSSRQGMITMKQDGILKAWKGLTTLSEVERVTEGTMSVGGEVEDDKG
jgi:type IV pilus assembly protein PilB